MKQEAVKTLYEQIEQAKQNRHREKVITLGQQFLEQVNSPTDIKINSWRLQVMNYMITEFVLLQQYEQGWKLLNQYRNEIKPNTLHAVLLLTQKSILLLSEGNPQEADNIAQEALHLARLVKDNEGLARAYQRKAGIANHLGHIEEAIIYYKKALDYYSKVRDLPAQMSMWNNIGFAEHDIGRYDKAITAYKEALKIARHLNHHNTGLILNNLGESYQDLYAMEQAYQYHQEALHFIRNLPKHVRPRLRILADVYRNLGITLYYLGKVEEALQQIEETMALLDKREDLELRLQTLSTLTLIELKQDNLSKAKQHAHTLLFLAQEHDSRPHIARGMHVLGLCYQAKGDILKAHELWQQCLFIAHDTGQRMLLWRIHGLLAQTAATNALTQVHKQIASEVIYQIISPIEDESLQENFLNAPDVRQIIDNG